MTGQGMDRRRFLFAAGSTFAGLLTDRQALAFEKTEAMYASCFQARDGTHGFALLDERGAILTEHRMTGRGHGLTLSPESGWAVAFARSPGNFAYAFRPDGAAEPVAFASPEGRHFFGHGAFSPDGKLLYATENDFEIGHGVIGVYESSNQFARIGEFPSNGIGPHEMILSRDGTGLWVANGGILTHPSSGKAKLNLAGMHSNVSLLNLRDGGIEEVHQTPPDLQRLSLRHMAIAGDGALWIGAQHEGSAADRAPLVARIGPGEPLAFADLPDDANTALKNYVGAVAASGDGLRIAFTSPVGNALVIVDSRTGNLVNRVDADLVCGIAGSGGGFVFSTETGTIHETRHDRLWDNHIISLAA